MMSPHGLIRLESHPESMPSRAQRDLGHLRRLSVLASLFVFSITLHAARAPSQPVLPWFTRLDTYSNRDWFARDVSTEYHHDQPISIVDISLRVRDRLDGLKEPVLLQIRLCGNQSSALYPLVHSNLAVVYNTSSRSRSTGCLPLVSAAPWQNSTPWRTIGFPQLPLNGANNV